MPPNCFSKNTSQRGTRTQTNFSMQPSFGFFRFSLFSIPLHAHVCISFIINNFKMYKFIFLLFWLYWPIDTRAYQYWLAILSFDWLLINFFSNFYSILFTKLGEIGLIYTHRLTQVRLPIFIVSWSWPEIGRVNTNRLTKPSMTLQGKLAMKRSLRLPICTLSWPMMRGKLNELKDFVLSIALWTHTPANNITSTSFRGSLSIRFWRGFGLLLATESRTKRQAYAHTRTYGRTYEWKNKGFKKDGHKQTYRQTYTHKNTYS